MTPKERARITIDELLDYAGWTVQDRRAQRVYAFHKPRTLAQWVQEEETLRARLRTMPPLINDRLWGPQVRAINNLEASLAQDRP